MKTKIKDAMKEKRIWLDLFTEKFYLAMATK
jgi:hypothetical protein